MIKINLLPSYIMESRRVKALLKLVIAVLIIEAAILCGVVWAPVPVLGLRSLSLQNKDANARFNKSASDLARVEQLEQQVSEVQNRFAEKDAWVTWVEEADKVPAKWRRYYSLINKYIPADVVVAGFGAPSGNVLSLSGQTSDIRAAARWYLNMLRCEAVQPSPSAVSFSTATVGWPGEFPAGANPKMQTQVSITIALNPDLVAELLSVPSPPASAGVGGGRGGAVGGARGGGRMGAGAGGGMRGGGGGMRGGGGPGAGGGRMGGGAGGGGGMRGGGGPGAGGGRMGGGAGGGMRGGGGPGAGGGRMGGGGGAGTRGGR